VDGFKPPIVLVDVKTLAFEKQASTGNHHNYPPLPYKLSWKRLPYLLKLFPKPGHRIT
jgi:hypothetical protein